MPTRRDLLKGAAWLASSPATAQKSTRRPNILFALADDWGWPSASVAGEPVVKTPVFDSLARRGVLFTNAFVSAPSCTPSRAAMLTGQWHWRLGEGANLLEIERFDRETGKLLAMIEKMGELDNTIVVMSGDNGRPFPRSKATLYDAGTHVPLAISWPARMSGGRQIDDFVSLCDLAPTFLEAACVRPPSEMTGRSLMPLLASKQAGGAAPHRDYVLMGMERHVPCRGEIRGGYPMRAIRTREFLYIRNFKPDRWPAGDPDGLVGAAPFTFEQLAAETFKTLADIDAGPTKAFMVMRRKDPAVKLLFELAAGKRPERELYDLKKDPSQMRNVAGDASYAEVVRRLDAQLLSNLKKTGDPRAEGHGDEFDRYVWYQGRSLGRGR